MADRTGYVEQGNLERGALAELLSEQFPPGVGIRHVLTRHPGDAWLYALDQLLRGGTAEASCADLSARFDDLLLRHPEGRLFDDRLELRWAPAGSAYRVLLLSESPPVEDQPLRDQLRSTRTTGFLVSELQGEPQFTDAATGPTRRSSGIQLWGSKSTGALGPETRIGRPLDYPDTVKQGRLSYRLYREHPGGTIRWLRLAGVK